MTVMVEKAAIRVGALGGVHHEIEDLPASILDGLGDHEGDRDAAGEVAAYVYTHWDDDLWRNAFLMALRQHIENQFVHHKAELQALYNKAVDTVQQQGRRAIVKAYINDALSELVEKAEWEERLHPRNKTGEFTYANREQQASLATAMLHSRGGFYGDDQEWEFTIHRANGKVDRVPMTGGKLPRLRRGDRVVRARQITGVHAPFTGSDDTVHLAEALGANARQAGSAGAVVSEMSRQGRINYGPNSWFTRLESASETMHEATSGLPFGAKTRVAIAMGKYVGKHGPEVSRVLGPHMIRARYKYKGTQADPSQWTQTARSGRQTDSKGNPEDIAAYRERLTRNLAQTKAKGGLDAVPTAAQTDLMLKSGNTPPSHGYILDSNGKVTSQAHGYGDDHYVPFNLRNLHSLNGGSYTRSRAFGGPTTEDIALAMKTGATGFNVISRNGIYRVNFTPRTNKTGKKVGAWAKDTAGDANQVMVDKYGRLLDRIKNGAVNDPETGEKVALNGRGYYLALQTLQKQFPYFIQNVSWEGPKGVDELKGLQASDADTDPGYVRPYYLKPSRAVQGYYDELLGGHHSFDEFDSHRLGRARVWAAQKAREDAAAARRREEERTPTYRVPVRREGEAPTNLPFRDRNVWAATGGGEGVGTRPQAEIERSMNVLSNEDASAYARWITAVLDHASVGENARAARLKDILRAKQYEEEDPNSDRGKAYQEYTDWYDRLKRDPDERAEIEDILGEVAPQGGTGLEIYNDRPILRSQGETEESVRGVAPHAGYAEDIEADDEFKARWGYRNWKNYQNWRHNSGNLKPDKQALVDYFETPREDEDWNGMSPRDYWENVDPEGEFDGLPYWQWYENQYLEAKHRDEHGTIEGFTPPHRPKEINSRPSVEREFRGAPQAGETEMDESQRRREESSHEREQQAEREADEFLRRNFPEGPPA